MSVIAIDLGGTKLASALFSDDGEIAVRDATPIDRRGGRAVGALIAEKINDLRSVAPDRVTSVGVAVPGLYRAERGTVWAPNIRDWEDYPLREELMASLGSGVNVTIDSDRAAYVVGESWRGVARESRNAIFVAVGTGIGAGLLVDGRVLRGQSDIAGAIGWLAVRQPYREVYAGCGCLEYHASGPGLVKVAREKLAVDPGYDGTLRHKNANTLTPADLFAAYDAGDRIAVSVLDDAVALWGMMAANLVSLFNPEIVVFGGGIFGPAARFLDRIRAEATCWAQPISMRQTQFAISSLGADVALYGAARLARGL